MAGNNEHQDNLRKWLEKLVLAFRKQHATLTVAERGRVSNLDDFSPPCQIEALWICKPEWKFDYQVLIFTHFPDVEDNQIIVHGPVLPDRIIETMENIIGQSKWQREIDQKQSIYLLGKGDKSYATLVEIPLAQALRSIEGHILRSMYAKESIAPNIGQKSIISRDSFFWLVPGDIRNMDIDSIVGGIIKDAKTAAVERPEPPKLKPARTKGFATYFYPPVWIGELPSQTLRERLTGASLSPAVSSNKAFAGEYKKAKVVVNNDGLLAIGIEDKERALYAFNEIMVAALLLGVRTLAVREAELGEAEIDPEKLTIAGHSMPIISLRTKLAEEYMRLYPSSIPFERQVISPDGIAKIVRIAEELTADPTSSTVLLMLLEGYTHFQNGEYTQSVIMTWVVIERWLDSLWQDFIKHKGIAGKRKQKLVESIFWTADVILETLNLAGKLQNDVFEKIVGLKRIRNNILHDGIRATKEEAEGCMNLASRLLAGDVVSANQSSKD